VRSEVNLPAPYTMAEVSGLRRLLPAVLWTGLVAWFSGASWGASGTDFLGRYLSALVPWAMPEQIQAGIGLMRKGAHVAEYAVLAVLWRVAWTPLGRWSWMPALVLAIATAILDELHQSTTSTRTGSAGDVLLDTAGASAGLALAVKGWAAIDGLIGLLLWIAAVGGALMLLINWAAAAPAPWLWLSVPTAWVALYLWRRRPSAPR
jgi:VanZ family protein